jgi:hypothetical protein
MDSGVRARKRLHSAGWPAAHLYWIPSSCTLLDGQQLISTGFPVAAYPNQVE